MLAYTKLKPIAHFYLFIYFFHYRYRIIFPSVYLLFYEKTRSINKLQKFLHIISNYIQNSILGIVSCKFGQWNARSRYDRSRSRTRFL